MPTFCCGSPWRTSVVLVHLPGSRLARQAFLAGRFWAKAGAQVGIGEADDVALFDRQRGAELDRLAEVGAEHVDRALAAQVVAGRVGAGDAAQDRQARLGRSAEEAVEEGALLAGRLGQGQRPGLDLAVLRGTRKGRLDLVGADLEAGDAADRLAGQLRAGRVGHGRGAAEHDGRARAGRGAGAGGVATRARGSRPARRPPPSRLPCAIRSATPALREDLDMPMLLS